MGSRAAATGLLAPRRAAGPLRGGRAGTWARRPGLGVGVSAAQRLGHDGWGPRALRGETGSARGPTLRVGMGEVAARAAGEGKRGSGARSAAWARAAGDAQAALLGPARAASRPAEPAAGAATRAQGGRIVGIVIIL